jgi:exonuclease VII small subunit
MASKVTVAADAIANITASLERNPTAEKDRIIADQARQIEILRAELEASQQALTAKDATIQDLIVTRNSEISSDDLNRLMAEVDHLNEVVQQLNTGGQPQSPEIPEALFEEGEVLYEKGSDTVNEQPEQVEQPELATKPKRSK